MPKLLAAFLTVTLIFASADATFARSSKTSSSHSSGHSSKGGYQKKCKTQACFKKHPNGDYYVPAKN